MWTALVIYTAAAGAIACLVTACEWLADHQAGRRAGAEAERQARHAQRAKEGTLGCQPAWGASARQDRC
jgi:hypothetical protein